MKIFLAIVSGFVVTLSLYAAGFVTAVVFRRAEPTPVWKPSRETASVWTLDPVAVDGRDRGLDRLPPRRATEVSLAENGDTMPENADFDTEPVVDNTPTAALVEEDDAEFAQDPTADQRRAHVQWCADRYRSYRVEDNSYTPYGGGRRECVSPIIDAFASAGDEDAYAEAMAPEETTGRLSSRHIQSCFDRYRSYRPADNTYQPYNGGPRRQCQ